MASSRRWMVGAGIGDLPECFGPECSAFPNSPHSGRQGLDALDDGLGLGNAAPGQIGRHGLWIDLRRPARQSAQGLHFGGERYALRTRPEIQRLDAHAVAGEEEALFQLVPNGDGEHPPKALKAVRPLPGVQGQDDLGIGVGAKFEAFVFQRLSQFAVVVHLAVEHDGVAPVGGKHGLMAGRTQVQDGEAAVAEEALRFLVDAAVVRAAVLHHIERLTEGVGVERAGTDETQDAAHFFGGAPEESYEL